MNRFFQQLRSLAKRLFFWHEGGHSNEFRPEPAHDHALVLNVTKQGHIPGLRQLRYIGHVLSSKEKRLLSGAIVFLVVGIAGSGYAFATHHLVGVPANGGRLIEAIVGAPQHINPLYAAANDPDADLSALVYSGLFKRAGGRIVPDIVERFEWSDEGRRLHLELRKDVRFHDGTPLTSEDVVFTLQAAKDPAWRSSYMKAFENTLIEPIDEHSLNINLKDPDVRILDALTIGILPAHVWADVQAGNAMLADANKRPVGSGSFMIRSFRRDSKGFILAYTLERFQGFYGIKPFLSEYEFRYFPDRTGAEDALTNGQVDVFAFVPGAALTELTKRHRLSYAALELPQETVAFLNLKDELLKNIKIRQALILAADREAVVHAQAGIAKPIFGPYPFEEFTMATSSTEERLAVARTLLNDAGWVVANNRDVRVRKETAVNSSTTGYEANASSTEFTLTITVPESPDLIAVAEVLKRQWSLLGAKIDIAIETSAALTRRVTEERDVQIVVWNVLLNSSQDLAPVWWSGAAENKGRNLSNLVDRNVDSALNDLRGATTTEAERAAQNALAEIILSKHPAVFLTRPAVGYVYSNHVKGVASSLLLGTPSDRFQDLPNWYVNTRWTWR